MRMILLFLSSSQISNPSRNLRIMKRCGFPFCFSLLFAVEICFPPSMCGFLVLKTPSRVACLKDKFPQSWLLFLLPKDNFCDEK